MNAERLTSLVKNAAKEGAAEALCNQCIFDLESIGVLNRVVKVIKKFEGYIIVGLALGMVAVLVIGGSLAYLLLTGGLS